MIHRLEVCVDDLGVRWLNLQALTRAFRREVYEHGANASGSLLRALEEAAEVPLEGHTAARALPPQAIPGLELAQPLETADGLMHPGAYADDQ